MLGNFKNTFLYKSYIRNYIDVSKLTGWLLEYWLNAYP